LIVSLCLSTAAAGSAVAQDDLSALEIMRKTDSDHRATDERGEVDMVLVSKDGKRQRRKLEIMTKTGEGDDDMNLIRFLEPPKVRGTAVLTLEATGRADDQWLYLPALQKKKRIASSNRTQRFAGTDFTFEDIRSEDFEAYDYAKAGEEVVDRQSCWVIEATPKEGTTSGYSKRRIFVEKERVLIRKIEFFDTRDRMQKTLELRKFEQIDGHWRAAQSMMEDHLRGTKTVWRFDTREINPGLPDSAFTPRALERGS
jgi:outer membrane lipoprotein-sorting protein